MDAKSVITCDLEGRIRTFNDGAASLFGWKPEEVIGKKRVQAFSPGLVVLGHLGGWLEAARTRGELKTRTVFLRRDGTPFAAEIRITPTSRDGEHDGYCGVTVPLPDVEPQAAMPRIKLATRIVSWMAIARVPFLTATIVPVMIASAWAFAAELARPFPWLAFAATLVAACAMQTAANLFNDYFDWKSGADPDNADYFMPFSGGSRSIELGLISLDGLRALATTVLATGVVLGGLLAVFRGPGLLWYGLAGAFAVYFYTAPPLRLVARKGIGELVVGLCFGPLMTAGVGFALTGQHHWQAFVAGLPTGFLTAAILWINEIPDAPADARAGKNHLVVVLGPRRAVWGYAALLVAAHLALIAAVATGVFSAWTLTALLVAPLGVFATRTAAKHFGDRNLIQANAATIRLQLMSGLITAASLVIAVWLP